MGKTIYLHKRERVGQGDSVCRSSRGGKPVEGAAAL